MVPLLTRCPFFPRVCARAGMLLLEFTQGYAGEDLPHSLYSSNVGTFRT